MNRLTGCMGLVCVLVASPLLPACAAQSDTLLGVEMPAHPQPTYDPGESTEPSSPVRADAPVAPRHPMDRAACAGVPAAERDDGPLARRDRIAGIELLNDRPYPKSMLQPAGVAIYLRATPGLTEQWLGRVLECHLSHHAVVADRPADGASPLFVSDARVAVSATGDGFRIAITARDVDRAREIIARAQALAE